MIDLTFREGVKLRRSLFTAFSPSAMEQVVYQLHADLPPIAGDDDYGERLVTLIVWAEINNRTADLIHAARAFKPGDVSLLEFEAEYQEHHSVGGASDLPEKVLTPELRHQLVAAVMAIPTPGTYDGRSAYLLGLPASKPQQRCAD
jgi:hypothetical protein